MFRFTGDPDLAEDLVQETFVRFLDNPPAAGAMRMWLFRVAANLACDAVRTRKRRNLLLLSGGDRCAYGDPPPQPDEAVEGAELSRLLHHALMTLSEKERTALLLREEGFKHHEIGEAIGAAGSSVGTLMARAIRKLATVVDLSREDL